MHIFFRGKKKKSFPIEEKKKKRSFPIFLHFSHIPLGFHHLWLETDGVLCNLVNVDPMEGGGEFRCWEELIPDALGLIFSHLPLQEILTVIPRVCKSWAIAVSGPYCWQEIDIEDWSLSCEQEDLDRMLQMLITRSSGSVRKLCISGLQDDRISFIADQ